jgi:hypothetical protein
MNLTLEGNGLKRHRHLTGHGNSAYGSRLPFRERVYVCREHFCVREERRGLDSPIRVTIQAIIVRVEWPKRANHVPVPELR